MITLDMENQLDLISYHYKDSDLHNYARLANLKEDTHPSYYDIAVLLLKIEELEKEVEYLKKALGKEQQ